MSTADITVYPVEERVGEDFLQRLIVELLRPMIERWLAERKIKALTGAGQFIYFRPGDVRRASRQTSTCSPA